MPKTGVSTLLSFCFVIALSLPAIAARRHPAGKESLSNTLSELKRRMQSLEEQLSETKADVESLKSGPKVDPTALFYNNNTLNQTYLRAGASLISARSATISQTADLGLGAFLGIGQYIGKHHVGEFAFEYDLYPSLSLRYRFEIHPKSPAVTLSPVIGYKIKIATLHPFDSFLSNPDDVQSSFFFVGANLGIPLPSSLFTVEFLYLLNAQEFVFTNIGVQFFI